MYKYPYGDSQQLNLDWILTMLKELKASGGSGGADLKAVANALVTLSFNLNTQYRRYDYCFLNGKLYRCLSDTSGVFDPSAWQEALIGDDLAVLTRWINAIDAAINAITPLDTSPTSGSTKGATSGGIYTAISKDNISTKIFDSSKTAISNLNGCVVGANFYDANTTNIPVANTSGTCYDIRSSNWHYQIAIDISGRMFTRIWNNGWSAWLPIVVKDDLNDLKIIKETKTYVATAAVGAGQYGYIQLTTTNDDPSTPYKQGYYLVNAIIGFATGAFRAIISAPHSSTTGYYTRYLNIDSNIVVGTEFTIELYWAKP